MQYKDEFICEGSEGYVADMLPYRKKESGCRIGQMLAEQFGHTALTRRDGQNVYRLEFIAVSIESWKVFMSRLDFIKQVSPEVYDMIKESILQMDESLSENQQVK